VIISETTMWSIGTIQRGINLFTKIAWSLYSGEYFPSLHKLTLAFFHLKRCPVLYLSVKGMM
jgi:hypothetical protein